MLSFFMQMDLKQFFENNPKVAVAFSGGVDSSYLLYAAIKYGCDVTAYYVSSQFQPVFELEDAKRMATDLNARMKILQADVLSSCDITDNPPDRCYQCKKVIFSLITEAASKDGYTLILDGTNASDDEGDRPGMRALRELTVASPLKIAGLRKQDVRRLSREAGLFTWDKPAYACLATRIPTGEVITAEKLKITEESEDLLFSYGLSDFRIRIFHGAARIQLPKDQIELFLKHREDIVESLKKSYSAVLLDLEVRNGQ